MNTLLSKNLWIVAAVSLIFGILFSWFFVGKQPGINFPLFVLLLTGVVFALFFYFKLPLNNKTYWYLVPLIFFSVMLAIRASMFMMFWNVVITFGLLLVLANHFIGKSIQKYLLFDYIKHGIVLPLTFIGKSFGAIGRLFTVTKTDGQKGSQIAKGILITLPILILFIVLMSSADLVFGNLVSSIFTLHFPEDFVPKFWWAIIVAVVLIGTLTYILENSKADDLPAEEAKPTTYKFGQLEATILFGTLSVLFAVFVIIQIKYLFAGHNAISEFAYTYAEYAHKGFGELVLMALISFLMIFGVDKYIEKHDGKHGHRFVYLSAIITVLLVVIMASAFTRLLVYEQAYGYTFLRILVQCFIIWLAAVFLWLLYKIIAHKTETFLVFGMFVSVLVFFAALNLMNIDAFIARKNINQFARQNKLDADYLMNMSADAIPEIKKLQFYDGFIDKYGNSLPTEAGKVIEDIKWRSPIKNWQSWNWSKARNFK